MIQNMTYAVLRRITRLALFIFAFLLGTAETKAVELGDSILDENFVIASIVVADPGNVLYSRVGHVGLHMQCPQHGLDFVFSYESEDVRNKIISFLSGNLKMGMFAIPFEEYLDIYRAEGRGVRQYTLNLPIDVKRNLWRVLDNHLKEGIYLPYDYITHGCAHSALTILKEGLDTIPIQYGAWPERFKHLNRRELTGLVMAKDSPWSWCFLNLITNGAINDVCTNEDKLIMPPDLVEVLQKACVQGRPLLDSEPQLLLDGAPVPEKCFLSPLAVSLIVLLLTVLCLIFKKSWMDYVLLVLQTVLGIITVYLIFFSTLCCTEWSWLIVPFNPLPLLLWKWRRRWALTYAIILVLWIGFILLWPHSLTDTPYIVLTIALLLSYINMFRIVKK